MSHYNDKIADMMYNLFNSHAQNDRATGLYEPVRARQTDGGKPTLKTLLGGNKSPMMAVVHAKKTNAKSIGGSYATYKKQAPVVKGGAKNMEIIESIPAVRTQLERVIGGGEDRPAYVAGGRRKKKPVEGATHINNDEQAPQPAPQPEVPLKKNAPKRKAPKKKAPAKPKKAPAKPKEEPKSEPPKSNEPAMKRRAKLVAKIMKERGVSMPQASKAIKDEKLEY
jgi:hypothetical protein